MSETSDEAHQRHKGGSLASRRAMGVRRLQSAVKKARGSMTQEVAAEAWGIALSTLGSIEQGVERNYRPATLAPLDVPLGRSAWDLYAGPDEPGVDIAAASRSEVEELRHRLESLEGTVSAVSRRSPLDALTDELNNGEIAEVRSFILFVLSRRRLANGA